MGLRTRVALWVAAAIALIIVGLTFAAVDVVERQLETSLREMAHATAVAVADSMELQPDTPGAAALTSRLRDFVSAEADLRSITVFRVEGQHVRTLASSTTLAAVPEDVARRAVEADAPVWVGLTPHVEAIVVPMHDGSEVSGAVAVSVSLASPARLAQAGRLVGLGAATVAVLALTGLVHVLLYHLVLAPVDHLRGVVAAARRGDLKVRAERAGNDELGEFAEGLNQMLGDLDELHRSLNERVAAATAELRERHEELIRSHYDILELRRALAHAHALAAAGQTMAMVAHQIGTPLNLASSHVQLLQRVIRDTEGARRLTIVAEQIARASTIVRDLLQRVTPEPVLRTVDVAALLHRLAAANRPSLEAAGVTIDEQIEDGLPDVLADETQLELALLNLVTNAIDATPRGGRLTVAAWAHADGVSIEVVDTGPGIPDDLLPHIFEPWVTTKGRGEGTGLGLSIARDVISGVGGRIRVETAHGRGTTFRVELPAAPVSRSDA